MALTGEAKEELSRLEVSRPSARKAEAAAMLRFAGGLHLVAGRVVVEAELDSPAVARRLHGIIADMYGHRADLAVLAPSGIRRTTRYIVRVEREGGMLARQTGLLDARGRPVRGRRRDGRRRGRVARRLPRPRHAHRARSLLGAGAVLPGARGGARDGGLGAPSGCRLEGPRGPRDRPGRAARRGRDLDAAVAYGSTGDREGLGGAPHQARGQGHRTPPGELRRCEPAPFRPGRRGGGPAGP